MPKDGKKSNVPFYRKTGYAIHNGQMKRMRQYPRMILASRAAAFSAIALLFFLLTPAVLAWWPVDVLEIAVAAPGSNEAKDALLRSPALLGRDVSNTIIHSVQLTPVIDIYRIQEGRICAWQEKIMSHNAGLPSLKPARGRFTYAPPWMIVEGTGDAWRRIVYRVGTERLGRNEIRVFPRPRRELWREAPGAKLVFQVVPGRL